MKMLRWDASTRLDKDRNNYIRGSFREAPIAKKVKESRMRWYWYSHIEDDHSFKKAPNIPDRPRGRRQRPILVNFGEGDA